MQHISRPPISEKLSLNDSRTAKRKKLEVIKSPSAVLDYISEQSQKGDGSLWYKTSGEFQFVYTCGRLKMYPFNWAKSVG